jgi:hypothetical protein
MSDCRLDEMTRPRAILPASIKAASGGRRNRDGSITIRRWDSPQIVLYGPYWKLDAGTYRLELCVRSIRVRSDDIAFLGAEVLVQNRIFLAVADFCQRDMPNGKVSLDFCVSEEFASDGENDAKFEFRVLHFGVASYDITSMTLTRIATSLANLRGTLRWQLSSRARRRWLTWSPQMPNFPTSAFGSGKFAFAPRLSLNCGAYRLSFRASQRSSWNSRANWLYVAIAMGGRLRGSRGYAIPAKTVIANSLEFEVPAELAYESGSADELAVEFSRGRGGSIDVTDVELTKRGAAIGAPGPTGSSAPVSDRESHLSITALVGSGQFLLKFAGRLSGTVVSPDLPIATITIAIRHEFPARAIRKALDVISRRATTLVRRNLYPPDFIDGVVAHSFTIPATTGPFPAKRIAVTILVESSCPNLSIEDLALMEGTSSDSLRGPPATPSVVGRAQVRAVIVGNCQAEVLTNGYRTSLDSRRLAIRYHFVNLQKNLIDGARLDLKSCDIVLIQDIADFEFYPLRLEIPNHALTCRFPMLRFSAPWPFDSHNGMVDRHAAERELHEPFFPNLDGGLGRLRREIANQEARFQAYRTLNFDWAPDVLRLARFEERRLLAMDQKYDFTLGADILENFRKRPGFHSIGHPNGLILSRLLQHINEQIGMRDVRVHAGSMDGLRNVQVPIHPFVARQLGIGWANERTRYEFRGAPVTWDEYIRRYIQHFG